LAEVINLNRARKARAKAERTPQANANRAKFGRTKAEKRAEAESSAKLEAALDGSKLEE
jgi:hypothetical protein